jgi:pSer/pThr/pTyr-binding forkhead associated (FHA) protein
MPPAPRPVPLPPLHDHTATRLETDDELMDSLRANFAGMPVLPQRAATESPNVQTPAVRLFRPSLRVPMAVLTAFDDGRNEGEQFRLRENKFVIGRTEGDLIIPHDNMISSRHVEITRQQVAGEWRWLVTDLKSTNGMFVRVLKSVLTDRAEFLVGSGRYRFLGLSSDPAVTTDHVSMEQARNSTQAWGGDGAVAALPSLVELVGTLASNRIVLARSDYWIGTDPSCSICRINDPYCEGRHARIFRDSKGNWQVEQNKSVNGLWFRLPQVYAESTIQFQIGEQRFKLQLGG